MELSAWIIYLFCVLHSLDVVANTGFTLCIFILLVMFFGNLFDLKCPPEFLRKATKIAMVVIIPCIIGMIFIPDRKTMVAMVAVPAVVNNEKIQNISKETLEFIENYIHDLNKERKAK